MFKTHKVNDLIVKTVLFFIRKNVSVVSFEFLQINSDAILYKLCFICTMWLIYQCSMAKLCVNVFQGQTKLKSPTRFKKVSVALNFFVLTIIC